MTLAVSQYLEPEEQRQEEASMASQARGLGPMARHILQRAEAMTQPKEQEEAAGSSGKEPLPMPRPTRSPSL